MQLTKEMPTGLSTALKMTSINLSLLVLFYFILGFDDLPSTAPFFMLFIMTIIMGGLIPAYFGGYVLKIFSKSCQHLLSLYSNSSQTLFKLFWTYVQSLLKIFSKSVLNLLNIFLKFPRTVFKIFSNTLHRIHITPRNLMTLKR